LNEKVRCCASKKKVAVKNLEKRILGHSVMKKNHLEGRKSNFLKNEIPKARKKEGGP